MYSIIENIAAAAIVIAILGKMVYSIYKTLKNVKTDYEHEASLSPPACTGSCGSCRACPNSRQGKKAPKGASMDVRCSLSPDTRDSTGASGGVRLGNPLNAGATFLNQEANRF